MRDCVADLCSDMVADHIQAGPSILVWLGMLGVYARWRRGWRDWKHCLVWLNHCGMLTKRNQKRCDARLRQLKPLELKSRSLGCLDNKALNRSVLRRQGWLVVGWSWPPIVSDSIFTNLHNLSARLTRALSRLQLPCANAIAR